MIALAVAWLLGACALLLQPALPGVRALLLVCIVTASLALALRRASILAFALGYALCWQQGGERLGGWLDPSREGRTVALEGTVASVPLAVADGTRFRLATVPQAGVPPLVELTWYEPDRRLRAAERLRLEARLRRPRGFANPGGADQAARMLREGIGATGYVRTLESGGRSWRDVARRPVLVARDEIAAATRRALGERPAAGIVAGLSVGLQDALSPGQWRDLARSGTSHLMAISGTHIGMLAALAAWIAGGLQRLRQRRGAHGTVRDAALVAGSLAATGYASLAGWSVPTQRTAIMIAVVAGALRLRRRLAAGDALALGAVAVLALEPLAPLAPGFWLSFGAVAAILHATGGTFDRPGVARSYVQVQVAVTAGLVPALAACFGSVSIVAAAVNLVAIPLYTLLIVPAVLAATALLVTLPDAGTVAMQGVAWLVEATWPVIGVPASWSLATWGVSGVTPWSGAVMAAGAAATLAPLPAPGRLAGLLLLVAACAWRPQPPAEGAARLALLDVGQGLAAIIETRRHVLVYDSGPSFRTGSDTGALVVEPYLRHRGRRRIDTLVASHDDLDHAGGAGSLARSLPVAQRVASGRSLDALGPTARCTRGARWSWDGVSLEWLHPAADARVGDNDGSCVLLVRAGPHAALLTGDIERRAEAEIVARARPGRIDVLLVPHHGSRTSSTAAFVAATRPSWALVPAGHRNRWGFPKPEVVQRWQDAGATVLVQSATGSIEFALDPRRAIEPPTLWRQERRRFWHDP
jgi:competence protein ComEC